MTRTLRFSAVLTSFAYALTLSACGSSGTSTQPASTPDAGAYHGVVSSTHLGGMVVQGRVSGSHLSLVFKDAKGESGTISGDFALGGSQCFSGTAYFRAGPKAFTLVDCSLQGGRLTATVHTPAAVPTGTLAMQSDAATPGTSGNLYIQYDYDSRTAGVLPLSSNLDDLLMSNYVAGAMLGHLLSPKMTVNRDRLYASIFAHLAQEDGSHLVAFPYVSSKTTIDNSGDATILGTGGPYQINSWYQAGYSQWVNGVATYHGLVNLVALQHRISNWTIAQQTAAQAVDPKPIPAASSYFNDKYWGPMAAAMWHYQNVGALETYNTSATSTHDMARCEAALTSSLSPDLNVLDMVLNASYNSGAATRNDGTTAAEAFIGLCQDPVSSARVIQTSLTDNTLGSDDYARAVGITSHTFKDPKLADGTTNNPAYPFYINYGRQLRFTADQLNGPSAGVNAYPASIGGKPPSYDATVIFVITTLETVFENAMNALYYRNASGAYGPIAASDAQTAFIKANKDVNTGNKTYLVLTSATDRTLLFDILDAAIGNLETTLKANNPNFTSFADETTSQL